MCFDFDSRPPELPADLALPPLAGGSRAELLELTSRDGTRFSAALAQAFYAAASDELALDGVVGFYGVLEREGRPRPADLAADMRCPVLGLFGGADQAIAPEHIERFGRALEEAGVEHELVTYPGAPHSFFDRKFEEHAAACEDAWRRVIEFLGTV